VQGFIRAIFAHFCPPDGGVVEKLKKEFITNRNPWTKLSKGQLGKEFFLLWQKNFLPARRIIAPAGKSENNHFKPSV
jgi:hypothetical protein